jgi:hypothetical protein
VLHSFLCLLCPLWQSLLGHIKHKFHKTARTCSALLPKRFNFPGPPRLPHAPTPVKRPPRVLPNAPYPRIK